MTRTARLTATSAAVVIVLTSAIATPATAVELVPVTVIGQEGVDSNGDTIFSIERYVEGIDHTFLIPASQTEDDGLEEASCQHRWVFRNKASYTSTRFWHSLGSTAKTQGCGNYRASVHVSLYKGNQRDTASFDAYTHSCANVSRVNATAITCDSPRMKSGRGTIWQVLSGHTYDIWNNGTRNGVCDGCLDFRFVHP